MSCWIKLENYLTWTENC